jgi:transposase
MYTDMQLWNEVRRAVLVDGLSQTQACQQFKIHSTTLKKMLAHSEPVGFQLSQPRAKPKIDPFIPIIQEILENDRNVPCKQRHTGLRIFERLREEHGYEGGLTILYKALADLKRSHRALYVPLKQPPGEAQFDFGFAQAKVNGALTKIAYAELSLPYSNVRYLQVFPVECTESFHEGLKRAFHFLGGVPTLIKFDNSKVAVRKIVGFRGSEPTREFLRIASHFLFRHHFCRVRQPQEKGHVENAVGYSRRNHLVPVPEFGNFDAFNQQLEAKCCDDMAKTSARKKQSIAELFEEEKKFLLPLPEEEFETRRVELRNANSLSLVRFHNNDYSVPTEYAHKEITVVGNMDHVRCLVGDAVIAVHQRDWGKMNAHYNPVHYLAIAERKPNTLDFGKPFEHWDLPKEFDVLRRRFIAATGKKPGMRQYIKTLQLLGDHSVEQLARAVRHALELKGISYETIRFCVQGEHDVVPLAVFALDGRPLLQTVQLPQPNLTVYTQYAKEQQYHEKTRNEIDRPVEASFETIKTADNGKRMRGDCDSLCEGERRSLGLPVTVGRAGTAGSRSESRRTTAQGGEVPELENIGELRFQISAVLEQDACQRTDARSLPDQSRIDHPDRPARHGQDAPGNGLWNQGMSAGQEGEILSHHRPDHEDDRSTG